MFYQSLTFSASANPIKYQGAKPVFIGSDHVWNMCPKAEADQKAFNEYEEYNKTHPRSDFELHVKGI